MRAERFQVGGAVQQRFRTEANELRRRTVLRQKWRIPPPGWDSERLTKGKLSLGSPAKQRRITNSLVSAGFAWQAAIFSVIGCGEGRGGRDKSHQRERERAALEIPLGAKLIGERERREGERRERERIQHFGYFCAVTISICGFRHCSPPPPPPEESPVGRSVGRCSRCFLSRVNIRRIINC